MIETLIARISRLPQTVTCRTWSENADEDEPVDCRTECGSEGRADEQLQIQHQRRGFIGSAHRAGTERCLGPQTRTSSGMSRKTHATRSAESSSLMSPRGSVLVGMRGAAGLELVLNECQPDFVASSPILLLSEPGSFLDQLGIRHSSPDILHRKTSRIVRFGVDTNYLAINRRRPAARDVGWSLGDLSVDAVQVAATSPI